MKAIIDEEIEYQKQFCRKNEERWAKNAQVRKAKQRQLERFFLELQGDLNRFKKKILEEYIHRQISDDSSKKLLEDQKCLNINDLKESVKELATNYSPETKEVIEEKIYYCHRVIKTFQTKVEVNFEIDFNKLRVDFLQKLTESWDQTQQLEHLREQQENEHLNEESEILKNLGEERFDMLNRSLEEEGLQREEQAQQAQEKTSFKYIKKELPDTEDSVVSSI